MLKYGIYDFIICRGGTDMCFVLGFGRKRPDLKQYLISGLTTWYQSLTDRRGPSLVEVESRQIFYFVVNKIVIGEQESFAPYPWSGQDKCRRCFYSRLNPFTTLGSRVCVVWNCNNALLASYCLDSDISVGNSCSTFSSLNSG